MKALLAKIFYPLTMLGRFIYHLLLALTLALIFFGIVTPLALLYRLLYRDFMQLKWNSNATYWLETPPSDDPDDWTNQY